MRIGLITDTHFGQRGDSLVFHDYMEKFYREVFFPYLTEHSIDTIIHLGDVFDRRKFINYVSLKRCKEYFFDPLAVNNIKAYILAGNHDVTYKNTNEVNSPSLLTAEYTNLEIVADQPKEIILDGCRFLLVPWINNSNYPVSMQALHDTSAEIVMGHLEFSGFEMHRGMPSHEGFDSVNPAFSKFDMIYSGHFHHPSTRGNITYLGAPYEMTWSDYNDPRGFHIFDTDTRSTEFIKNPFSLFMKLYYDDLNRNELEILDVDLSGVKGSYIKVIVKNKTNQFIFDTFIDRIEKMDPVNLQIIEDLVSIETSTDEDILSESEDTLTMLHRYVEGLDIKHDKKLIDTVIKELYVEALSLEVA